MIFAMHALYIIDVTEHRAAWKCRCSRTNEDAMATEKRAEGIRQFARDQEKLEAVLATL